MARCLYSYVVRYDSGFAPNPFFRYCTLATCKPGIRERAQVNDWIVGTASNAKGIRRGGHLVFAMRVTEILSTHNYWADPRFAKKKPTLYHNWVSAPGDNIYELLESGKWQQLNSYHSQNDGTPYGKHIERDTKVQRILVSDDYVYYGGEGPLLPERFLEDGEANIHHSGRNYRRFDREEVIAIFEEWIRSLGVRGYQGKPWDWMERRK